MSVFDVLHRSPPRRVSAARRRIQWLSVSLLVLGAQAACSTEDATEPSQNPPIIAITNATGLADMFADEQARVVPGLPASARRAELLTALDALTAAVRSANATRAQGSVVGARAAVENYAPAVGGDAGLEADLDALRFAVDAIDAQVIVDLLTGT